MNMRGRYYVWSGVSRIKHKLTCNHYATNAWTDRAKVSEQLFSEYCPSGLDYRVKTYYATHHLFSGQSHPHR